MGSLWRGRGKRPVPAHEAKGRDQLKIPFLRIKMKGFGGCSYSFSNGQMSGGVQDAEKKREMSSEKKGEGLACDINKKKRATYKV